MTQSEILRNLALEDSIEIKLLVYFGTSKIPLEGTFSLNVAKHIIRNLPPIFSFGYIPVE